MSKPVRYIMVGGFLGAGKTTAIAQLAKKYTAQGLRVGIVTNDQATDLVDTNLLRSQGMDVGEVAGACFCCNFNEMMSTIEKLGAEGQPDIILGEPVGSCTDLVATVIQPLKHLYDAQFSVAPYGVILKPSHGKKILQGDASGGFSPKAEYILRKQLEEADFILINRIDELSGEEAARLEELVKQACPTTPVLRISAKTGEGFDALIEFLGQEGDFGQRILDIDYDIYAEGEAELGWLNSSLTVSSENPFSLDEFLLDVVQTLQTTLREAGSEPAHLKTIGLWEGYFGVANLISSDAEPQLSLPSNSTVQQADVIVNARVACDPEQLTEYVKSAVEDAAARQGATAEFRDTQSFRPGRPVPTHRYSEAI